MKLLTVSTAYSAYVHAFYARRPELVALPFAEQEHAYYRDAFGWADAWSEALRPLGYETLDITLNVEPLQRAWARESGMREGATPGEIVVAQAKTFRPDVLWFQHDDAGLLRHLRAELPGLKLALGWVGSSMSASDVYAVADAVLSCAPESVEILRAKGVRAAQLHHAFDPRIPERLATSGKDLEATFVGQLVRRSSFHLKRERLLEGIRRAAPLEIFSPSALGQARARWRSGAVDCVLAGLHTAKALGFSEELLRRLPAIGKLAAWSGPPRSSASALPSRPGVFGLEMYEVLRRSKVVLNIHADSSPHYASNMRLFETTGVGSCLLTDHRENLAKLFEPDREVVVYRSAAEAADLIRGLLDRPAEREAIAAAGRARTLEDHTFARRAPRFDTMVRGWMRR